MASSVGLLFRLHMATTMPTTPSLGPSGCGIELQSYRTDPGSNPTLLLAYLPSLSLILICKMGVKTVLGSSGESQAPAQGPWPDFGGSFPNITSLLLPVFKLSKRRPQTVSGNTEEENGSFIRPGVPGLSSRGPVPSVPQPQPHSGDRFVLSMGVRGPPEQGFPFPTRLARS